MDPFILLADRFIPLRDAMQTYLQDLGARVATAGNVVEATNTLEELLKRDKTRKGVVVTNVDLHPKNGGFSVLTYVRDRYAHVPVIMMELQDNENNEERAREEGAIAYLLQTDALFREKLLGSVSGALDRQKGV